MGIRTRLAAAAGGLAIAAMPLAMASAAPEPATTPTPPELSQVTMLKGSSAELPARQLNSHQVYCVDNNHGSYVCFQPYGDIVWVYQYLSSSSRYESAAHWRTNYGREGTCYHNFANGRWSWCNYNMREGKSVTLWAVNVSGDSWRYWSTGMTTTI